VVIHGGSHGQPFHQLWRSYACLFLSYSHVSLEGICKSVPWSLGNHDFLFRASNFRGLSAFTAILATLSQRMRRNGYLWASGGNSDIGIRFLALFINPVWCIQSIILTLKSGLDDILCVLCICWQSMQHFSQKDPISKFRVCPGGTEALFKWGGKIKHLLIAYFLGNISAKNYQNWFTYVKVIATRTSDIFFWDKVYNLRESCRIKAEAINTRNSSNGIWYANRQIRIQQFKITDHI